MLSPRSSLALLSPSTQRTASMMLDLPQPLGPTTPTRWPGNWKVVGSAKDLKPASLIWFRRIGRFVSFVAAALQVLDSTRKKRSIPERVRRAMIASRPLADRHRSRPCVPVTHPAAVAAVLAAGLAAALNVGKVPVALPLLRAELGLTLVQAGWVSSMLTTLALLGAAFVGMWVGRIGALRMVLAGLALCTAGLAGRHRVARLGAADGHPPGRGPGLHVGGRGLPGADQRRQRTGADRRLALSFWSAYMPAGASIAMLASPLLLPATGWHGLWWLTARG